MLPLAQRLQQWAPETKQYLAEKIEAEWERSKEEHRERMRAEMRQFATARAFELPDDRRAWFEALPFESELKYD